jgi:hypothetical protein
MVAELRATTATFARGTNYKVAFIALGLVDLFMTLYALGLGYTEQNPVFAALQHDPLGLFLLKVAAPVGIAWLSPACLLLPSIALLCAVIGWNVGELARGV